MRFAVTLVAAGLVCSMTVGAEARARGGGFFKGGRSSPVVPAAQARSGPSVGVGVGVVVPVGYGRSERASARGQQQPQQHLLPLPPRPAEEPEGARIYSASAETAAPKRPWCQDGKVVGRGSGFCEVSLAADRSGAPALLALGN